MSLVEEFKVIIHCDGHDDQYSFWNWHVPLERILYLSFFGKVRIVEISSDYSEVWVEKI